ncbi:MULTISPECIES: ABC transporter substrate-binding protein [Arthrobacter]|uniref:ABC transporter substrate-binding protein n=1 Tax=Arthrobacter jinronghuae TaxID=2964609 RepID=A0ABT1NQ74_9MICC|nr:MULTISPECIES: ABC transporter substrate-binding protein [Arthrobacter]MCQ1948884.1 ABC transporter substrate-binding protein [Arthrobacter jinronghuae]MCQ1952210.1 ABC transporter substrate-binding protein [Arthrobacter sp. zg-Y238]UWX78311.1 ABC transporter substrate-binding protein [Arthrobacter jinronghuae]
MTTRTLRLLGSGALAAALTLTGCASGSISGGADTGAGGSASDSELRDVKIGLFPSSAVAAIQLGVNKGYFEEEGLNLEMLLGQGSAAQLPSLSSGSLDFMLSSPTTPLVATAQGLDLKIVSGYASNRPEMVEDSVAVMVGPNSDIHRAKDLEGKTVSINALGSIGDIGIREAVELDGGDPDKVTFVQLGFNEVGAQLESGQIQAGMVGPPFMQQITADGGAVISDFIQEAGLGGAELVIASSGALVEQDPEVVESFISALDKTLSYAEEHQDEVRDLLPEVLGTSPEMAAKTDFIAWNAHLDVDALKQFADLMTKHGIVETRPDLDATVWSK